MSKTSLNAAIVGCGNIAGTYTRQIADYDCLAITGFFDLEQARAKAFAAEHGGRAYASLDEVLADESVDIVVNLTIHHVHYKIIRQCLEAGKHVHTEKPLALSSEEAHELVNLAAKQGLRLSSAPTTYMGEGQQTAWKQIRDGRCGTVRLVYAEVNHGRIERWHPNPDPFYDVGILWDVGAYPLTLVTTFFGPVTHVVGHGRFLHRDRITSEGREFTLNTPDYYLALLDTASGVHIRLSANFYVEGGKQGGALEFHGDDGSVYLGDFQGFGAAVEFAKFGEDYEVVAPVREPYEGIEFARGVQDLAEAILEDRPHRAQGAHAAHVVEVIEAISKSAESGKAIELSSTFPQPEPMPWGM